MSLDARRLWSVAGLLGSVGFALWVYFSWSYIEDDGFIHMEFARNLANGAGFSFDGRLIFADSSPLWVFALAALGALLDDVSLAAKVLSILAVGFAVWSTASLSRVLFPSPWLGIAMTVLVLASPYVLYWSMPGMESVLALGVSFWILKQAFYTHEYSNPELNRTFALMGLAPLVRFELALEVALLGVWVLLQHPPKDLRRLVVLSACGFLAIAPIFAWMVYAHYELGSAVPTTSAAKRIGQSLDVAVIWQALRRAIEVLGSGYTVLVLGAIAAAFASWRSRSIPIASIPRPAWLLALWPGVLLCFYVFNRTAVQTRYSLLIGAPVLLFVGCWLRAMREAGDRPLKGFVIASALLIAVMNAVITVPHMLNKAEITRDMNRMCEAIRRHLPPDAPIATYAIGQIAFLLPNPIVDTGALTMPEGLDYLADPEAMLAWAVDSGAVCVLDSHEEHAGFDTVLRRDSPPTGWIGGPRSKHWLHCRPGLYQ
jgi:hypothetical protein